MRDKRAIKKLTKTILYFRGIKKQTGYYKRWYASLNEYLKNTKKVELT